MIDWASYVRSTYNGVSAQMPIQFPSISIIETIRTADQIV